MGARSARDDARPLRPEDGPALARIWPVAHPDDGACAGGPDAPGAAPAERGLVIERGGEIVAAATLREWGRVAQVHALGVRAEHRRQGLGGRLLAALVEDVQRADLAIVGVELPADDQVAAALLGRHGFRPQPPTWVLERAVEAAGDAPRVPAGGASAEPGGDAPRAPAEGASAESAGGAPRVPDEGASAESAGGAPRVPDEGASAEPGGDAPRVPAEGAFPARGGGAAAEARRALLPEGWRFLPREPPAGDLAAVGALAACLDAELDPASWLAGQLARGAVEALWCDEPTGALAVVPAGGGDALRVGLLLVDESDPFPALRALVEALHALAVARGRTRLVLPGPTRCWSAVAALLGQGFRPIASRPRFTLRGHPDRSDLRRVALASWR